MADLVQDFVENENPDVVRYVSDGREARDVYAALKAVSFIKAVLFMEYWRSYSFTGRVPEGMRRYA